MKDANPNGDPDAGNMPRVDSSTGQGLITDGAIKRRIRDTIVMTNACQPGFDIYVQSGTALHRKRADVYAAARVRTKNKKAVESGDNVISRVRAEALKRYYAVRTFGAVMSENEYNCGQV